MEWIDPHWRELTALAAVVVPTLIQVSPIKVNPWSALARALGRALNREMMEKADRLQTSLDNHIAMDGEHKAKDCRRRVLRFNDELIQGSKHTKEHFDDVLEDITEYERYCRDHADFKNHKAIMAIENVKRTYQKCEDENSFL